MAAPGVPTNIYAQQGNMQVYIAWDFVSGATSYQVQRSTDGITFASYDTSTTNSFTDETVTLSTQYWYQVASINSDGTGQYSQIVTAIPTLPGYLSLYEARLRAQQRADRVNSQYITTAEWNFFINQAYYELYDLLILTGEEYYVSPRLLISTDGTTQMYDLPDGANYDGAPALYKLYGVDLGLDNSTNAFVTLKKFQFIQRNRYVFPQLNANLLGVFNLQYRLVGNKIMFIPTPSAQQNFGIWYYPRLTTLLAENDVMDGFSGWTQYVIVRAAKYALNKEESDTASLDDELKFIKARIEDSANTRDAGQPDSISDARTWSERWGAYGSPNGDGPSGGF